MRNTPEGAAMTLIERIRTRIDHYRPSVRRRVAATLYGHEYRRASGRAAAHLARTLRRAV